MDVPSKETQASGTHPGLAFSTLLLSSSRALEYALAGVAGLILARSLGPDGRGLYSLITEAGALIYAPVGLGVATAGVYLSNQGRLSQQTAFSNALAWLLGCFVVYLIGAGALLAVSSDLQDVGNVGVAVVVIGGALGLFRFAFRDFLAAQGRITAVAIIDLVFPVARLGGVLALLGLALLETEAAVLAWLVAVAMQVASGGILLTRRLSLIPSIEFSSLRQQLWYGARGHAGWLLQSLNHRFDVFILGYFSGTAAVGYYAVAFNLAEMTWWMPMALGTALFPKASSMNPDDNAALTASVLRRTLPLTVVSLLALMVAGWLGITLLYGSAFEKSVLPFLFLAPSGIFYTVFRLLSISLTAQGRPQAGLYGGLVSVPVMLVFNLLLTPRFDAVGAAIASDLAYLTYAGYLIWYFTRATRIRLSQLFVPSTRELTEALHATLAIWSRLPFRGGRRVTPRGDTA